MKTGKIRNIIKIVVFVAACVLLVMMVIMDILEKENPDRDYLYVTYDKIRINSFKAADEQCLFLPRFFNEDDLNYSRGLKEEANVRIMHSSDIPAVFITTSSGSLDSILEDQTYKESGKIVIMGSDGQEEYSGGLDYIKGRGNYSWNNWDKKPFGISLRKEASLLGLGKGKKYALIANASDATLIRNDVARDLEAAVNLEFSHTGQFTDLYINGDYQGVYYLVDTLDIAEDRINITNLDSLINDNLRGTHPSEFPVYETPQIKGWNLPEFDIDITGGYLIEREFGNRYEVDYDRNPSCFETEFDEHFLVKSPQYCSKEQINYIADFITETEKAVRAKQGNYLKYIDLESMTRKYLVEEFTKNYDAGVSSSYFYKDIDSVDGRLHAAPGWDYDMSLGNYLEWMDFGESGAYGFIHMTENTDVSPWWEELFVQPEFANRTIDLFNQVLKPYVLNTELDRIDILEERLKDSSAMDYLRWQNMYDSLGYVPGDSQEYDKLKQFMLDRIDFLEVW